jgi:hypothetical protein
VPAETTPVPGPQAGERAPDARLVLDPAKRLYDLLRHPGFTLVAIPGADHDATAVAAARVRDALDARHPGRVRCHLITDGHDETGFDFDHRSPDETGELRDRYELDEEGRLVLIRPDLYVGLSIGIGDAGAMTEYLDQWFVSELAGTRA